MKTKCRYVMTNIPAMGKHKLFLIILVSMAILLMLAMHVTNSNDVNIPTEYQHIHLKHINKNLEELQSDPDYSKLINISFSFMHLPLVCKDESPLFIVIVHTAPGNFEKRKVIRQTWADKANKVKVLFATGLVTDENVQNKIEEEYETEGDFLQGNFIDSYHNLTYKHVMLLKYMVHHCPNVQYLVKLDDDVFVNMPNLKTFLHLYDIENKDSEKILCSRMYGNPVLREGRWGVPIEEYPDSFYPYHCSGFAVIYPRAAIFKLNSEAQKTNYFWIDDVFVSGILAKGAKITHTGIENLILSNNDVINIVDKHFVNITKPFLFGRMNLDPHQIKSLWDFVSHHTPKVSILEYLG
nr:beta-1,3-galactosyltransferase 1-like isoform X1 [Leptinotarsa decemlineata]